MREIEIKARVTNEQDVLAKLRTLGLTLGKPIKQYDTVYGQPQQGGNEWGAIWLRIRTENDKTVIFTLKRSVVGHLDSIEHEVEVSNASELEAIIGLLGFKPYSKLTKIRSKGTFGMVEICLDKLPELGDFIEAEMMMEENADHDKVVKELWDIFSKLGISKADEIHEGYDVLLRKKLRIT